MTKSITMNHGEGLYDVFSPEICQKLCRVWYTPLDLRGGEEICPIMPCKHCRSTDPDHLIQELDWVEDGNGCRLLLDVYYGKKNLNELQLETVDFNKLLARLARFRRVNDKKVQIQTEIRKRSRIIAKAAYDGMSEEHRRKFDEEWEADRIGCRELIEEGTIPRMSREMAQDLIDEGVMSECECMSESDDE
jgi:hypothetical protein